MLRALIFDVDGTLAETERDGHRVAFNRAFADAGLPWHWDEEVYGELLAVAGGKERLSHWWRQVDPADAGARLRQLHARKTEHYAALVRDGTLSLRPGVRALIDDARERGITLAIATTTTLANVEELLAHTLGAAAPSWFKVIGSGDIVSHKKPAPAIYRYVLGALRLPARDCIAFEDCAAGVAAALGAGLPTVLTRSLYAGDFEAPGVLADLDELTGIDVPTLAGWLRRAAR